LIAPLALGLLALPTGCARVGARAASTAPPLESGDLVFLDLDCGELCEAMAAVTAEQHGVPGPALSHVGLLERERGALFVLEAWPRGGVTRRPLAEVLARVRGAEGRRHGFRFGRLRPERRALGRAAVQAARELLGAPYDEDFLVENGRLYCSELVYLALRPALRLSPMFFGRPGTPEREVWERYYRARGRVVPDGAPGISPLGVYLQGRRELFVPEVTR